MKKVVIIRAGGNELANQLWNYASIFAYAKERGYSLENPSFFEYGTYFQVPRPGLFLSLTFFLPFRNYTERKTAIRRRIWRKMYAWYAQIAVRRHAARVISSNDEKNIPYYLSPSAPANERLAALENDSKDIYFDGWLFRNPLGLKKYHRGIREYFKPRNDIAIEVEETIKSLRKKYSRLIGVHMRQGDYATWRGGAYLISHGRAREIMDEYLAAAGHDKKTACFVVTSDGPIEESAFKGLNVLISKGNAVHDLFLLASTDAIIGSNSTFGAFASFYGDLPFVVMQGDPMDWPYYSDKKNYFENRYATFVHY